MKQFTLALLLSMLFFSCKKEEEAAGYLLNESYGSKDLQKFDIYFPENNSAEETPVLFLFHGGAWRSGDKSDFNGDLLKLKALFPAYAIVNANYRLFAPTSGLNKFPAQEEDVKACIEYVLNHHTDYKISQKFAVFGSSAGAHLAMLYAYKHGSAAFRPFAVIDCFGPTEMIKEYKTVVNTEMKSWIVDVAGDPLTTDSTTYINSSPLFFVTAASPPTLILQGKADQIVSFKQSELLSEKLNQLGVKNIYKLYPNEPHGFSIFNTPDAMRQMQSFLYEHMN